ncbi:hypothetical protein [Metasolibacillus fluoroglycofenilyticus]|uniref:hypothetical protein n=1 Tax=Metasolibacillus fluoroglycofenilyticus TaxID=1239396 RepID=UPI00191394DE|nr:hypothetical protein [Metasolibacillus fluoroglycofenilyticus]
MHTVLPIKLDHIITINYSDGTNEQSNTFPGTRGTIPCTFQKINGYDANNNRITNLVGYNGQTLLKKCPSCKRLLSPLSYGANGRVTGRRRDQSQCSDCRSSY